MKSKYYYYQKYIYKEWKGSIYIDTYKQLVKYFIFGKFFDFVIFEYPEARNESTNYDG